MMFERFVLKDCFGRSFLFSDGRTSGHADAGTKLAFFDSLSADRFLRNFNENFHFGLLASALGCGPEFQGGTQISEKLCHGKISVYALPSSDEIHHNENKRTFSKANSGERFSILTKAEALATGSANQYRETDTKKITLLLESLSIPESKLKDLTELSTSASATGKIDRKNTISAIANDISSGKLVLLLLLPRPASVPSSVVDIADLKPEDRTVPLAPQSEYWIEVKLLDENGEAFANQAYCIEDADGTKHTGNTDAKGSARLDKIPAGDCVVSFPRISDSA